MNGPDLESSEAQEYFLAVEKLFARLRGSWLNLPPIDRPVAVDWFARGIPLEFLERVLGDLFAKRRERRPKDPINSLRYCNRAVIRAWEEVARLAAAGYTADAGPLEVAPRLAALASALPAELPGRADWAGRLLGLAGSAEEVEEALSRLDRELLARLAAGEDDARRRETTRAVEAALARLAERLPAEEIEAARERLESQVLRQRWGLPVLSLFSPEAEPSEPSP